MSDQHLALAHLAYRKTDRVLAISAKKSNVTFGGLKSMCATTLVSDNGPQFTANDFSDKMNLWGIKHVFSPPYHPCSNGAAKRGSAC